MWFGAWRDDFFIGENSEEARSFGWEFGLVYGQSDSLPTDDVEYVNYLRTQNAASHLGETVPESIKNLEKKRVDRWFKYLSSSKLARRSYKLYINH